MTVLLTGGKVWNGEKFFCADVLVKNGVVCKVKENISESADFVYDASGKIVSAGLVDAHIHMRGVSSSDYAMQPELATVPFGVTAAADAWAVFGNSEYLDTLTIKTAVFAGVKVKSGRAVFDCTEKTLAAYGNKAVGVKLAFDESNPEIFDINPLLDVIEFADKNKLSVLVHSTGTPVPMSDIVKNLRRGDILTHAFHGGRNNAADDGYECLLTAKKKGIVIDAGFAGHVHTDFSFFRGAVERGILPDVISSDITRLSAYTRGGIYGLTTCMSIAKDCGMSETDIFKAVTSAPARALKKENEWGVLKEGTKADIAVIKYTDNGYDLTDKVGNRVYSKQGYLCELTLVNGDIMYRR